MFFKALSTLSAWVKQNRFLLERGAKMNLRRFFPASAERTPWHVAILSLVPFILPGPLSPLFAYHPWWDPAQFPFIDAARVPVAIGLLILGFMIGILRKFPRWAYLYSLYILVLLPLGVITLLNQKPFNISDLKPARVK
jgi:hypothetical protein